MFYESTVMSLYFDTDSYRLIRSSVEKPLYKEKLRLRSYNTPENSSTVFLELKKKFKSVVYKRRQPMTLEKANEYLLGGGGVMGGNQPGRGGMDGMERR